MSGFFKPRALDVYNNMKKAQVDKYDALVILAYTTTTHE